MFLNMLIPKNQYQSNFGFTLLLFDRLLSNQFICQKCSRLCSLLLANTLARFVYWWLVIAIEHDRSSIISFCGVNRFLLIQINYNKMFRKRSLCVINLMDMIDLVTDQERL